MDNKQNIQMIYELSSLQAGIYFDKMANPNSTRYVIQNIFKMKGAVNEGWIRRCVEILAQKYDVLRTSIIMAPSTGKLWQVILKNREIEVNFLVADSNESIERIKISDISRNFDLQNDSLLRLNVIKTDNNGYTVLWTSHHIIIDGWCNGILLGEFLRYYNLFENGYSYNQILELVEDEKTDIGLYKDYISYISRIDKHKASYYWKTILKDYDSVISIIPSRNNTDGHNNVVRFEIDTENNQKIGALVKSLNVTKNSIMEAAWGLLLMKYNAVHDVVFGKVVSGRNHNVKNIESSIGLYINTIPVRCTFDEKEVVGEVIKNVFQQSIASQRYDFYPLGSMLTDSGLRPPMFNTLFVYENYYVDKTKFISLETISIEEERGREETEYDICVGINDSESIELELLFNSQKYSDEEMNLLLKRYQKILMEFVAKSEKSIQEITMVTQNDSDTISEFAYPEGKIGKVSRTVIDAFEEQVRRTPQRGALIYKDVNYTYEELNNRINQLAWHLMECGIKGGSIVPVISHRTDNMLIALYAILKCGAAYSMIDTEFPKERIDGIIDDYEPLVVIIGDDEYVPDQKYTVLKLSDENNYSDRTDNLGICIGENDIAYLTSTSGTTGKPKSVMCPHGGVMSYVEAFTRYFGINENTVALQHTSYGFDTIVEEVFPAHITGGKVVLYPEAHMIDFEVAKKVIAENGVTFISCSTLLLNEMNRNNMPTCVKLYVNGGDKLEYHHIDNLIKTAKIGNTFGPTEATVCFALAYVDEENKKAPIGRPIYGREVYIIQNGNLCGIGVPGEICVAGSGISAGYYKREELTKEKFEKNPYGEGRLYHTGDLGRWLPNGEIDFLGRIDDQVKIRGYRVELKEVEAVIMQEANVKVAVVVAKAVTANEKKLVAYIQGTGNEKIDISVLKSKIRKKLPEYMVPQAYMQLESIPTKENGKVDKSALPEVEIKAAREYVAPKTEKEKQICRIISEILDVKEVGVNDNFFELGGDSIRCIRVVNQGQSEGLPISIKDVMSFQNIGELALHIDSLEKRINDSVDLSNIDSWIKLLPDEEQVCDMCLDIDASNDEIERAIETILQRHPVLMVNYTNAVINNNNSTNPAYNYESITLSVGEDINQILENTRNELLGNKKICYLVKRISSKDQNLLYWVIRRELIDEVSMKLFIKEFAAVLEQIKAKQHISVRNNDGVNMQRLLSGLCDKGIVNDAITAMRRNITEKNNALSSYDLTEVSFQMDLTRIKLFDFESVYGLSVNDLALNTFINAFYEYASNDSFALLYVSEKDLLAADYESCIGNSQDCHLLFIDRKSNPDQKLFNIADYRKISDLQMEKEYSSCDSMVIFKGLISGSDIYSDITFDHIDKSTINSRNKEYVGKEILVSVSKDKQELLFKMTFNSNEYDLGKLNLIRDAWKKAFEVAINSKEITSLPKVCNVPDYLSEEFKEFWNDVSEYGSNFKISSDAVKYSPTIMQELFVTSEKGISSSCFEVDNITNVQSLNVAINELLKLHSALRTVYDSKANRFYECTLESDIQIPCWNLSKYKYSNNELKQVLSCIEIEGLTERCFNRCPHIFVIKLSSNRALVYIFVNHSLWDMSSSRIFKRHLNEILKGNQITIGEPFSCFVKKETMTERKKEAYLSFIDAAKKIQKVSKGIGDVNKIHRVYPASVVSNSVIKDQLGSMIGMLQSYYSEILGDYCPEKMPVGVYYHNRNKDNTNTIGVFQDIKFFVVDLKDKKASENVISNLSNEANNCVGLSDISKFQGLQLLKYIEDIPCINTTISYGDSSGIIAMDCVNSFTNDKASFINKSPLALRCNITDKGVIIDTNIKGKKAEIEKLIDDYIILS